MRLLNENEDQLQGFPPVTPGKDYTISDIPFYGDMTFKPALIQWKDNIKNPFYNDDNFKSVDYYLNKSKPGRASKDKNTLVLKNLFDQHPDLKTPENLKLPLGKFALKLKDDYPNVNISYGKRGKSAPAYKLLVNPSGGEDEYVSFKAEVPTDKGLYIWVIDNVPTYIGVAGAPKGLHNRVNNEYGQITSYKCSIDGQSQTCRSNMKLRDEYNAKKSIALYVLPIDVEKYLNDDKFMDTMRKAGFKLTRKAKNVLEIFEKFIIDKGNFKGSGWNRRT